MHILAENEAHISTTTFKILNFEGEHKAHICTSMIINN
jgi:hypothetical protein